MYKVSKRIEIAGAHSLGLTYASPCGNLHGHNWIIEVTCACKDDELDENGMVIDFAHIKRDVKGALDHKNINDVLGDINPTAENLAWWICNKIPRCVCVVVQESEGNTAMYQKEML